MPIIPTHITQHTLWQALTGQIPPRALAAAPIGRAVLDSRDVLAGDLFVALAGQFTDGHRFIPTAVERDAAAILCEERGRDAAAQAGALIVDCTAGPQAVGRSRVSAPGIWAVWVNWPCNWPSSSPTQSRPCNRWGPFNACTAAGPTCG